MNDDVLLTVWCLTYNHIKYVRQALEGIVNQKTSFKYNIFVFDDASTDGTSEVVREYAARYDNITAIIPKHNSYGKKYRRRFGRWLDEHYLVGKYVAWCELDDLWIDNNKLQIQVDYMETHPEYSLTMHNAVRINEQTGELNMLNCYGDEDREVSADELIARKNGNVASCSMVFRRDAWFLEKKSFFKNRATDDISRQLNAILYGKIYYFSRVMSVYHYKSSGAWTVLVAQNNKRALVHGLNMIAFYVRYNLLTKEIYNDSINYMILDYYGWMLKRIHNDKELLLSEVNNISKWEQIFKNTVSIYKFLYDEDYIPENIVEFCQKHKNIYIYGIGEYGTLLANKFDKYKVKYDGFIQTDKTRSRHFGKPVYSIIEASKIDNSAVIVGMGAKFTKEIEANLKKYKFLNWLSPFNIEIAKDELYKRCIDTEANQIWL